MKADIKLFYNGKRIFPIHHVDYIPRFNEFVIANRKTYVVISVINNYDEKYVQINLGDP